MNETATMISNNYKTIVQLRKTRKISNQTNYQFLVDAKVQPYEHNDTVGFQFQQYPWRAGDVEISFNNTDRYGVWPSRARRGERNTNRLTWKLSRLKESVQFLTRNQSSRRILQRPKTNQRCRPNFNGQMGKIPKKVRETQLGDF